jgi:hypothetical protein
LIFSNEHFIFSHVQSSSGQELIDVAGDAHILGKSSEIKIKKTKHTAYLLCNTTQEFAPRQR